MKLEKSSSGWGRAHGLGADRLRRRGIAGKGEEQQGSQAKELQAAMALVTGVELVARRHAWPGRGGGRWWRRSLGSGKISARPPLIGAAARDFEAPI